MRSAQQCPTFDVIESKADIETIRCTLAVAAEIFVDKGGQLRNGTG